MAEDKTIKNVKEGQGTRPQTPPPKPPPTQSTEKKER